MRTKFHVRIWGWAALFALANLPLATHAQLGVSLSVGNTVPVTNALGWVLPGNNGDSDNSCRVEIRQTWTEGSILAPTNEPGQLETYNRLITNSYLGQGNLSVNPGKYTVNFKDRLPTNVTYYARVFYPKNLAEAIYYADTAPFSAPSVADSINPEFGALKRIDGTFPDLDSDGDGIPDAMEGNMDELWGLDPNNPDTDGDGFNDGFEVMHSSYLTASESGPDEEKGLIWIRAPEASELPEEHVVSWWAVPGVGYRLDYRPQWTDEEAYEEVWSGPAPSTNLEVSVESIVTNIPVKGYFRWVIP